jgi:hypothetical protein
MKKEIERRQVEVQIDLPENIYLRLQQESARTRRPIEEVICTVMHREVFGLNGEAVGESLT